MAKTMSQSKTLASKLVFAALSILKEKGGEIQGRSIFEEIEKTVNLDSWAKQTYEKTGKL